MTKFQAAMVNMANFFIALPLISYGMRNAGENGEGPWQYSLMAAIGFLLFGSGVLWHTFYTKAWWKWPGRLLFGAAVLAAAIHFSFVFKALL